MPRCTCPSSSAELLINVFSRKPVEACVCITVWSWRLKVYIMTKVVLVFGNCGCAFISSNAAMSFHFIEADRFW